MKNILVLQLDPIEKPGFIAEHLVKEKEKFQIFNISQKNLYIPTDLFSHLIVLPSPHDTFEYKDFPCLSYAKSIIRDFIFQSKPVLGTCMGSQLVAEVLGEKIVKVRQPEIGFFTITRFKHSPLIHNVSLKIPVFEWHAMEIATTKNIVRIAGSDRCKTQIFQYKKNVFGVQFHLEINKKMIQSYIRCFDLKTEHLDLLKKTDMFKEYSKVQEGILDNFISRVVV